MECLGALPRVRWEGEEDFAAQPRRVRVRRCEKSLSVFSGGMYVGENTSRRANVRALASALQRGAYPFGNESLWLSSQRIKKPAVSHQSPPRVSAPKRVFLTRLALDRAKEKFAFPKHMRRFGAKKFGASMRKRDVFCIAQALFRVCAGSAPGRPRAALKNCLVIVWRARAEINLVNFSD